MALCTAHCEMLLFQATTIVRDIELTSLKKEVLSLQIAMSLVKLVMKAFEFEWYVVLDPQ